jgi:putative transposase
VRSSALHILSLTPAFKPVPQAKNGPAVSTAYDHGLMSAHSYSRCWIHLIWGTLSRERLLNKKAAAELSRYLVEYADEQGLYMKISFVNPDHVHALVDLPTRFSIEKVVQLLKGSSSRWVNAYDLITGKFAWGRGYGAFSVSHSNVDLVARYIADQEEHHRVKTFTDELREFIDRHGLGWHHEGSR